MKDMLRIQNQLLSGTVGLSSDVELSSETVSVVDLGRIEKVSSDVKSRKVDLFRRQLQEVLTIFAT